jgi:hypothetical protein
MISPSRGKAVPEAVVEELARLKALYDGFGYRELARILLHKVHERIDDKTVKRLWHHSPTPARARARATGVYALYDGVPPRESEASRCVCAPE